MKINICNKVKKINKYSFVETAYGFRYIPLKKVRQLFIRINEIKTKYKKYMSTNANNVYIEFEDIKFIIYKDSGVKVRTFWNGFEVVWERTAFDRTKRRLNKWFN